jgi:hypothetical protein
MNFGLISILDDVVDYWILFVSDFDLARLKTAFSLVLASWPTFHNVMYIAITPACDFRCLYDYKKFGNNSSSLTANVFARYFLELK